MIKNQKRTLQLSILFFSHVAILFSGMGLFPLLPHYAQQFGANTSSIGLYLSFTYFSITAGTLLTGWLPARVNRKALFLAAGLAGIPALILMGHITSFWQLVVLTSIVWFTGGIGIALVQLFTSQQAGSGGRGRIFGLQSLASPLGALLGGATVGYLIDTQGYRSMFMALALVWALWPLLTACFLQNTALPTATGGKEQDTLKGNRSVLQEGHQMFGFILLAVLLTAITISIGRLGLSLTMNALHFRPGEISSTSVVGGLSGILLMLAISASANRLSTRFILLVGFLAAVIATLLVTISSQIQFFRIAAVLFLFAQNINRSMSFALVVEALPSAGVGKKLSWVGTANWAANIVGSASVGPGLAVFGTHVFYLTVAVLPLIASFLIISSKPKESFDVRSANLNKPQNE
jgi:predicted MFS family arabinose efflux permease